MFYHRKFVLVRERVGIEECVLYDEEGGENGMQT